MEEKPNSLTTPYERALGESGKENTLLAGRKFQQNQARRTEAV